MTKNWKFLIVVIYIVFPILFSVPVFATSFNNDFTQANDNTVDWIPLTAFATTNFSGYPCLTAGKSIGTGINNTSATSNIPGCDWATPDAAGVGSLRFTPAETDKRSAILSNRTFPTSDGLQVTFTTYTYGGTGADGMTFFMSDGTLGTQVGGVNNVGASGGSLGYSCSNVNDIFDGIEGAYLGLGMDEYGNFLNSGDNTSTGILNQTSTNQFERNRIGLRGAGNVRWHWLNAYYPARYPSTLTAAQQKAAVQNTCKTGTLWSYANANNPAQTTIPVLNYAAIPGGNRTLPSTQPMYSSATTRANAFPITYKLRITPSGLLTYMYSYNGGAYQPVLTNFPITTSNGALPASVRFGFSAATGGSTNVHELSCFVAGPTVSSSSASGNIIQGQQVKTTTKVFLASYDPDTWAGSVAAYPILNTAGTLSVSTTADWDTGCKLTGGGCTATGAVATATAPIAPQAPSARNMITWNGTQGIPLQWSNLTSAQQTVLNSTDSAGQDRLNWLRGNRTKEQTANPAGNLRARDGVLGDVINSSPTWVGPPSLNYDSPFTDKLYSSTSASAPENATGTQSYATFASNNATRTHVVYTGANDGMLHGSRAGSNNSSGNFDSTNNDGSEVLAFMPSTVLSNSNIVNLTAPTYGHNYFVDAAPGYGDLFYNGSWHTWMVGGLGAGGAEIYALDITDPTNFTEANANTLVKGSWTPSSLTTCTNFANTGSVTCGNANMGNSYGTPIIRRLHNGRWAVIFGNGLGSANQSAGVFVGLVNPTTGAVSTFYWLDAFENGTTSNPNGISYTTSADIDGDHITDYLYGGDLQGNVWRFDLTSSNPADWRVTDYSNPGDAPGTVRANPSPLFTAKNSAGTRQPITTRIATTKSYANNASRVILGFATGQAKPITDSSAVTYANNSQTVYGIWDWNLNKWNTGSTTPSAAVIPAASATVTALSSAPSTQPIPRSLLSNTSSLLSQTTTTRGLQLNTICWQGSADCTVTTTQSNNQYGWLFDLPDTTTGNGTTGYEQVIYNPTYSAGVLLLNTTIPAINRVGQCIPTQPTGWTMAFNIESGGGVTNSAGQIVNVLGSSSISNTVYSQMGLKLNGVGSPFVVSVGSQPNIVTQTNTGNPEVKKFNPQGGVNVKRISWEQLR